MALAAAQVVDAYAALVLPQSGLGGRVKTSRTWPWDEAELPACRVFASDEVCTPTHIDGANQHDLSVDVQYTARATADLDDALHALAAAGLALLFAGTPPYGMALAGISRQLASEGEAAVGQITLQLKSTFFVHPAAPETLLSA